MSQQSTVAGVLKEATGMSIGWGTIMILLGFAAVILPFKAGIAISAVVGWIIVLSGIAYLASAFAASGAGGFVWRVLIGVLYVVGGGYLAFHATLALESLTIVVATLFFIEGVFETAVFFEFRGVPGAGWILFDAVVTLILAYLIWRGFPSSSTWAIGTLVGINLIMSGTTRLMYSVYARKTLKAIA
jgi:uncharacterized membrane protein HdeD (DUF308 family)